MTFSNIPNGRAAKGYAGYLTNVDNVLSQKYSYDNESMMALCALDINWCGAQLTNSNDNGGVASITTTEELLTLINTMNERLQTLAAAVVALSK